MNEPLLIEIGVEELPAIPFLKELPNIEKKWLNILQKNKLLCDFEFFYTPRRLVLWHKEFQVKQEDFIQEMFGAPIKIAFKDGKATNAALSFAKKCGVSINDLEKKSQSKGEVLYFKKKITGANSKKLLNNMVNEFVNSLNFGKSMRWTNRSDSFIRPIRSLSIMLSQQVVEAELFGVKSSNHSFGHKMLSFEPFDFDFAEDYFCKLSKHGVILYQGERKKLILEQMKKIEKENNVNIEIDLELLNEIVAITEYPTTLIGSFDEEFLNLPQEVIITSMKKHQKYFAVYKNQQLTNKFVVVSNSKTNDFSQIIAGNEKVLRPRLTDAMFFWKNDIKNGLSNKGLEKLIFVKGLGSMYEKLQREEKIALFLCKLFREKDKELVKKAVMLSKADLMSEMVYEFTELQGLMGYYYAKIAKENKKVYTAIKEQYLPDGKNSQLPSSLFSSIIALAYKLDNLMALFCIGKIPSGTKDPFALRRAASGIIKISINYKLPLDLNKTIDFLLPNYKGLNKKQILEFFNERLFKIFDDVNASVLKAVLGSKESNIYEISKKLCALNPIVLSNDFKEYSTTFKRVANIIKDLNTDEQLVVKEELFTHEAERQLYDAFIKLSSKEYNSYEQQLDVLFALKPKLDNFFDKVYVNHEDENIKTNRKNIIGRIYQAFKKIADIKEITI